MVVLGGGAIFHECGATSAVVTLTVVVSSEWDSSYVYMQGCLAHKKKPTPLGPHRTLGTGLLYGPAWGWILGGEEPFRTGVPGSSGDPPPSPLRTTIEP